MSGLNTLEGWDCPGVLDEKARGICHRCDNRLLNNRTDSGSDRLPAYFIGLFIPGASARVLFGGFLGILASLLFILYFTFAETY
jgi:hypothetical protein